MQLRSLPIVESDVPREVSISNREFTTLSAILSMWIDNPKRVTFQMFPQDAQELIFSLMGRLAGDCIIDTDPDARSSSGCFVLNIPD